jgi:hypothetical protein
MRQEQRQPAQATPLGLAEDRNWSMTDLRTVGEIAELRFPDVERARIGGGETVFERHHRLSLSSESMTVTCSRLFDDFAQRQ